MAGVKSDLKTRALSACVMLVVAALGIFIHPIVFIVFVLAVGAGLLLEWNGLVAGFTRAGWARTLWRLGGVVYFSAAEIFLMVLRTLDVHFVLLLIGAVISVDIGAYFAGRFIGGPKIAPKISPSKTWAGLLGGAAAATAWLCFYRVYVFKTDPLPMPSSLVPMILAGGLGVALIAQAGDFFESWMKRRAGVKDSGKLIPGHGGLFDRLDGLIAVCFVCALMMGASLGLEFFFSHSSGGYPVSG